MKTNKVNPDVIEKLMEKDKMIKQLKKEVERQEKIRDDLLKKLGRKKNGRNK